MSKLAKIVATFMCTMTMMLFASALALAADAPVDVSWYTDDPGQQEYFISNASELRGLSALVNGTAQDGKGGAIEAQSFEGITIYLTRSVSLAYNNTSCEFTPIGTLSHPFAGTFFAYSNVQITNLYITSTYQNAGLFGYATSTSSIEGVVLLSGSYGGVNLQSSTEYIANVGTVVGYTAGEVSGCSSNVPVYINSTTKCTSERPMVLQRVGGIAGYVTADMDSCGYSGSVEVHVAADVTDYAPEDTSLRVADSVGGVVGRFGDPNCHGTLSNCYNEATVFTQTTGTGSQDRFGTTTYACMFFVGGVCGYSNGSITGCHNGSYNELLRTTTGTVNTSVISLSGTSEEAQPRNNRGADQTGGICGGLRSVSDSYPEKYNDGDPDDQVWISDCYNEGQITGLVSNGGIVGETGVYCGVTRCYNGTVSDPSDWTANQIAGKITSTRWNKPFSGGICGLTRSGTISYCANYAEVRNIQTGYYQAGIVGGIFTSDDYPAAMGELYACLNTGGVYTINASKGTEYREAGICGENEGYVHDCLILEGCVPYHSDSCIGASDWGYWSNLEARTATALCQGDSSAYLNQLNVDSNSWDYYWFNNGSGYPVLNTWVNLPDSKRTELTKSNIASIEQVEPASYVGESGGTVPTLRVTLTNGTVLVQNADFYVVAQTGAHEMSEGNTPYLASIVGIGNYRGTVENCAAYGIGKGDLSRASIKVSNEKYNLGKVVFPTSVSALISSRAIDSAQYNYVIYSSRVSSTMVQQGKSGCVVAFDSLGYISYDAQGNVKTPVSQVGIDSINAETRDWWLWDRNGEKIADSTGAVYYTTSSGGGTVGAQASGHGCTTMKADTQPAGYVVKVTANDSSAVLEGTQLGYYAIDTLSLYKECDLVSVECQGQTWYWDADENSFYTLDNQGQRVSGMPSATFTGETISYTPYMTYTNASTGQTYQLQLDTDIRLVNGDPNPATEDEITVDETDANRNVTDYEAENPVRAAVTIRPVDTSKIGNYLITLFGIKPAALEDCDISLSSDKWACTGGAVEPPVNVVLNGVTLVKDKDYTVEYSHNTSKGTASYTVTAMDNLSGGKQLTYTGTFQIVDGQSISSYTLDSIADQQFNYGYDVHPTLTFRNSNGSVVSLVQGTDYTVSYSTTNVTKYVGTTPDGKQYNYVSTPCTATISGIGMYTGSIQASFNIVPYDATANSTNQLRAAVQDMSYGTWGNYDKVPKNMGLTCPVMRVQAYPIVNWSAYASGDYDAAYGEAITLGCSNNDIVGSTTNTYPVAYYEYDSSAQGGLGQLVSFDGSQYTSTSGVALSPKKAQPGTLTATVEMRVGEGGTHNGAVGYLNVGTFSYTATTDLGTQVTWGIDGDSPVYNGQAHTPIIGSTTGGGFKLTEGKDYTIEYSNNVAAGTATYTVTAIEGSGYIGTYVGEFTILPGDVTNASISDIDDQLLVSGQVCPSVTVTLGGRVLEEGTDYTVSYRNNTSVGTGTVVITGCNNYTGVATKTFEIVSQRTWKRLMGETRYETAVAIASKGFTQTGGTVIVACGKNFPDGLAANGLAGLENSPVLLSDSDYLPDATKALLEKLAPSKVYVIGGTAAINNSTYAAIASACPGASIARLWGETRFNTALEIYKAAPGQWGSTCIVASGSGFADALSVSPVAYAKNYPIFLVGQDSDLDEAAKQAIASGGFSKVIIVGGTVSVSSQAQASVEKIVGANNVKRLWGENRYLTSKAISEYAIASEGMSASYVSVASGAGFADALGGGAFCGSKNSVMLLVSEDQTDATTQVIKANKSSICQGYIFGGNFSISQATEQMLNSLTR